MSVTHIHSDQSPSHQHVNTGNKGKPTQQGQELQSTVEPESHARAQSGKHPATSLWSSSGLIQAKLEVGAPNDALEQEADAVADKVSNRSLSTSKKYGGTGESVQRKCADCEEEKVQRKAESGQAVGQASANVSSQIQATKGNGQRLDGAAKSAMENGFGTDFSQVNIHTGDYATRMNRELNALAFTVGNDIYFNSGQYQPESADGKRLLAHELTHTLQQSRGNAGGVQRAPSMIQRTPAPRRRTIWLSIGFDSSARADSATIARIRASINREKAALASCCSAMSKACDVDLKAEFDWNRVNKPAPTDGNYDQDVPADVTLRNSNLANISTPHAGLKVLVTTCAISQTWQGVRIGSNANTDANGILWNRAIAPDDTLAHEGGHAAGYTGGDIEGNAHSSDPNNLMSRGNIRAAGALPDRNWCDRLDALAT